MALKIQKKWWYDTLDADGISRFARFAVDEIDSIIISIIET